MSEDAPREELVVEKPATEDARLYSVTTIIKAAASNEGLVYWSAEETAKAAVAGLKIVHAIIEEQGEDAAVEWLTGARFRRSKGQRSAAELGTDTHKWMETYALTGERPPCDDELRPLCDQIDGWFQRFQPEFEAAELTVYSTQYGYAGTLDAVMTVDGVRFLVDLKTTRKSMTKQGKPSGPYPEAAVQLAAYRFADFAAAWRVRRWENFRRRYYLLGEDERQMAVEIPKVDTGLVIHVAPEHCDAYPTRCDEQVFDAFCYMLENARWGLETSKGIFGEPLVAS